MRVRYQKTQQETLVVGYYIINLLPLPFHILTKMKQMKLILLKALILLSLFYAIGKADDTVIRESMILHPEQHIKITDWSFFVPFGKVAIIHHVTIENNSDIAYKDIKVRVSYYSGSYSNYGTKIGGETGILPITVPSHSKNTYLEGGSVFGSGSSLMYTGNIEVLGATSILEPRGLD